MKKRKAVKRRAPRRRNGAGACRHCSAPIPAGRVMKVCSACLRKSDKITGTKRHKGVYATMRAQERAAARNVNPSKLGAWYKGPRGVKVRVRKQNGKLFVDLR